MTDIVGRAERDAALADWLNEHTTRRAGGGSTLDFAGIYDIWSEYSAEWSHSEANRVTAQLGAPWPSGAREAVALQATDGTWVPQFTPKEEADRLDAHIAFLRAETRFLAARSRAIAGR